jgi:hypothetical protein
MIEKGMLIIHSKKKFVLILLNKVDLDFCEHCVYGKHRKELDFSKLRKE